MKSSRLAVFALSLAVASGRTAVPLAAPATLAVPDRANANLSLASQGSFVVAVWSAALVDGTTDIYTAVSRDRGVSFSAPVRVNSTAGEARANGEQAPRVALVQQAGGAPQIDIVWLAKRETRTVLLSARSSDGGRSFTKASIVPGSDAAGMRGWQSLTSDNRGGIHASWLDHRRLAERDAQMEGMHHHDTAGATTAPTATKPDGVAMAQLSQLYVATLGGGAATAVTGGVCFCCKTAIASGPAGDIYVAWRHVYPGNLRDIAFTSSRDSGRTFAPPARVSEDKWAIEGCPEDGPVLALDQQARVHIVWPTVVSNNGEMVKALFHAVTRDGRSFSPRVRLPSNGQANHPQMIVSGDGALVVAWDETGGGSRRLALARGKPDAEGRAGFERLASSGARVGAYPALAGVPGGFVVAWTAGDPARSTIQIESFK